jgi:hypothetical protein
MYIIINERERERGERETEYYVAFGRRIADEGVYEMLTCSKLNADLLDVFRGGYLAVVTLKHLRYDRMLTCTMK